MQLLHGLKQTEEHAQEAHTAAEGWEAKQLLWNLTAAAPAVGLVPEVTCVCQDSHHHVGAIGELVHAVLVIAGSAGQGGLGGLQLVQLAICAVGKGLQPGPTRCAAC